MNEVVWHSVNKHIIIVKRSSFFTYHKDSVFSVFSVLSVLSKSSRSISNTLYYLYCASKVTFMVLS